MTRNVSTTAPAAEHPRGRLALEHLAVATACLLGGCEAAPGNLSPSSLEDPAQATRARAQAAEVVRTNHAAEAAFHRGRGVAEETDAEEDRPTGTLHDGS